MAEPKGSKGSSGAMRIDADLVRELAELLTANALTEIEVAEGDRRIRVCRDPAPVISGPAAPAPAAAAPAASAAQPAEPGEVEEISGFTVKSPMVGTAFMSSEPGAAPFVETGDAV